MKYVVELYYRKYEFEDMSTAITWMTIAINTSTDPYIERHMSLTIEKGDEEDD